MISTTPVRPSATLCRLTDTNVFKKQLKTVLFDRDLLLLLYGAPGRFVERRLTKKLIISHCICICFCFVNVRYP